MPERPTKKTGRGGPARTARPRKAKAPARWNDAPRRGNPLGLFVALAAAAGLVYTACAPKEAGVSSGPAPAAAAPRVVEEPVVPRARYRPEQPASRAPREEPPSRPAPAERPNEPEPDPPAAMTVEEREVPAAEPAPEPPAQPEPAPAVTAPPPAPNRRPAPAAKRPVVKGEFSHNPAAVGEVAVTFDASYDDKPLAKILAALAQRDARATFFLTGEFAQRYPKSVERIADAGMELGNHSWSHPSFTKISDAEIERQLSRTNGLLEQITGRRPVLFRPPFGARDARVRRVVAEQGFETIYWALDSWDSVRKGITAAEIEKRVLSRVRPGDVVLMHIGSQATADALPGIMRGLDQRGLRVVPVSELMAIR